VVIYVKMKVMYRNTMFVFSCVSAVVKKKFAIHGVRINYN